MALGMLIFTPSFAAISEAQGWRTVALFTATACAVLIPIVFLFVPESPQRIGTRPWGAPADYVAPAPSREDPISAAFSALSLAVRKPDFWLLFATFFVCGFTTNGLVGTHMISFCSDRGMEEVRAAGLLAFMGIFNVIGTTGSGWLTDRFDARLLLFIYYGVRGLSLLYLPFSDFSLVSLSAFAVFYGLDWIATVPPTLKLINKGFGETNGPIIYGWVFAGHQIGAASAAFIGGAIREWQGQYMPAFLLAGAFGLAAAFAALAIGRRATSPSPEPA
jgi:predicted MFS family arabinose efflux permease